jgi:hypothetical protein
MRIHYDLLPDLLWRQDDQLSGTSSMASIPNGKFDFESEALKLYESDESDRLFATARDRFPSYQPVGRISASVIRRFRM